MNKTRDQIRRKFKALEKKHPKLAEVIYDGPCKAHSTQPTLGVLLEMAAEEEDFFFGE